jgi:glutamate/tyrosine decarboxylase-like PLP-dependent enzyme
VLFRDPNVGTLYKHDSPATYFSSREQHLGEISLECSRPGASAAALWATQKLLPLVKGGEFARGLEDCRRAALDFCQRLERDVRFVTAFPPELDIVVFAPRAESVSKSSEMSRKIFEAAARKNLHLAVAELPVEFFAENLRGMKRDRTSLTCLRSVLMKPEHREWIGRIWEVLSEATEECIGN